MEKVNKVKVFYNLANAQGIQVVVPPPATTTSAPTPASILAIETSTSAPEAD